MLVKSSSPPSLVPSSIMLKGENFTEHFQAIFMDHYKDVLTKYAVAKTPLRAAAISSAKDHGNFAIFRTIPNSHQRVSSCCSI